MAISFQELDHLVDLYLGGAHFVRLAGYLYLGTSRQQFKQGEFSLQNFKLTVIDTEKFNWIYGFEVDDRFCQSENILLLSENKKAIS